MPSTMDAVKLWYNANGSPVETRLYPEAASQTFKRGDLVYLVSGKVTVAATASPPANVGNIKILGIAEKDASGVTNSQVPVALATETLRWVLPVSTSASAIGGSANTAAADIGVKYEVSHVADNKWSVDVNAIANPFVIPTRIMPQYGVVDTTVGSSSFGLQSGVGSTEAFGWYECKFNSALVDLNV